MDLIAYLHPTWAPLVRPAPSTREWMDATTDAFAYRCLPLNIANAHGWEILSPIAFDAMWDGGTDPSAITVRMPPGAWRERGAVSLFGHGVLTMHIEAVFRTPPGWNLWISGSPNRQKDGIAPLNGVMETDWTPFTFTMNWRFTRPNHWVHFDEMEPICFIFPVQRAVLETFEPRMEPMPETPTLMQAYSEWSDARNAFSQKMKMKPPKKKSDSWQKHYMRGTDTRGNTYIDDHRTKLRLKAFDMSRFPTLKRAPLGKDRDPEIEVEASATPRPTVEPAAKPAAPASAPADAAALGRRQWLVEALEAQRVLSPRLSSVPRAPRVTPEVFLDLFYASARPVVLTGLLDEPARAAYGPDALRKAVGAKIVDVEVPGEATAATPFDQFVRGASKAGAADRRRVASRGSARNARVLASVVKPVEALAPLLSPGAFASANVEVTEAKALERLQWAAENRLTVQLAGRRRFRLLPPAEAANLYEADGVLSEIEDLDSPSFSLARFPNVAKARQYEIVLEPGEALFLPIGWWRQATALSFGVSVGVTAFVWPNAAAMTLAEAK